MAAPRRDHWGEGDEGHLKSILSMQNLISIIMLNVGNIAGDWSPCTPLPPLTDHDPPMITNKC